MLRPDCLYMTFALLTYAFACGASAQCNHEWRPVVQVPGVIGGVFAITPFETSAGPRVLAGGNFLIDGAAPIRNIAAWDGSRWHSFGELPDCTVRAFLVHDGVLYAGGNVLAPEFPYSSGFVVRWSGTAWEQVGLLLGGHVSSEHFVSALAMFQGELYAAGFFPIPGGSIDRCVARWNGSQWQASGLRGMYAYALAEYQGELYAGGFPWNLQDAGADGLRRFDGVTWRTVGTGPEPGDGISNSLFAYDGSLYCGGSFSARGNVAARNVARWDGAQWHAVGPGPGSAVVALTAYAGELHAASALWGLERWDGGAWEVVGGGAAEEYSYYPVSALCAHDGRLFTGGRVTRAGNIAVRGIAAWDGQFWTALGESRGPNGYVTSLVGTSDALYASGRFFHADGMSAKNVARWDGVEWTPLGDGLNTEALVLHAWNGQLIAGGRFSQAGGTSARGIASWDGQSWDPLVGGVNGSVYALASDSQRLYVGGLFETAGKFPARDVAAWDGAWSALGAGPFGEENPHYHSADALVIHHGGLFAGGFWSDVDYSQNLLAAWHDESWQPIALTTWAWFEGVNALASHSGELYVAGAFQPFGEPPISGLVRFDGVQWSGIGGNPDRLVNTLAVDEDLLFVGGEFRSIGGIPSAGLARWDGAQWSALGGGIAGYGEVLALAMFRNELYVGGTFAEFGGRVAPFLARYALTGPPGDADGDHRVDLADLSAILSHFGTQSGATTAEGDFDADGDVDLQDLALLLVNFGATCP